MSNYSSKNSSIFLYIPIVVLAIVMIGLVFNWQFKGGEEIGASLPPPVKELEASKIVNHRALAQDTGLAADGKMLYTINCASCHGTDGTGNGPRAAGLNPPPRNYKMETFKFGNDVASIYNTLEKGSPGTSMPSYSLLPPRDVWAMVHYVRTLIPNPMPTDDAIVAKLPEAPTGAGAADAGAATTDATSENRIPIALAMQQVQKPGYYADKMVRNIDETSTGAQVYLARCASCHGQHGEGMANAVLGGAPYRYTSTQPLYARNSPWLTDRAVFDNIVINGQSGRVHPGNGTLTKAQLEALYTFVQGLATN